MSDALPPWTPLSFDAPPELSGGADLGCLVVMVATTEALETRWAQQAAVELAKSWRAQGRRVILADGGVMSPTLHAVFGLPNGEGLSDAVLFGASPGRIAQPVGDDGVLFVPAGTAVPEHASVFGPRRWSSLVDGFRQAGATLVLLVPEQDSLVGLLHQADDVVVLGTVGAHVTAALGDPTKVRALLHEVSSPDQADDADDLVDPLDPLAVDPLADTRSADTQHTSGVGDGAGLGGAAGLTGAPDAGGETDLPGNSDAAALHSAPAEPELRAAPPKKETPARPKPSIGTAALAVFAVAALVLAAGWYGFIQIPGISPGPPAAPETAGVPVQPVASSPEVPPAEPAAPPTAPPTVTSSLQAYSLTLASFREGDAADARRQALSSRVTGALLHRAPLDVGGTVYHRLLLGPATDSAEALLLGARVAADLSASSEDWLVRATPLAFLLSEVTDAADAQAQARAWRQRGIPGYVLSVRYSDGTVRFRIYAGGFADENEAAHLREAIAEAGLADAALVQRVGELPN